MTRALVVAAAGLVTLCGALLMAPVASAQDGVDGLHLRGRNLEE